MPDDTTYHVPSEGQQALPLAYEVDQQTQQPYHVQDDTDGMALRTQDDSDAPASTTLVALDSTQWDDLTGRVGELRDMESLSLFLLLLLVCGVAALFGGHLWRTFSEGFRR